MPALADPATCCSIVCIVPQVAMLPVGNGAQPTQMLWMTPVSNPSAPVQFMIDAGMPSYDVSGAAAWSWPALQSESIQPFGMNGSCVGGEQAPQQLPMDCVAGQSVQQVALQDHTDMLAWEAAPMEPLQLFDFNASSTQAQGYGASIVQDAALTESTGESIEEAPEQFCMEMTMPVAQEAEQDEERGDVNADDSHAVSKNTLRRRRRQHIQVHSVEAQQPIIARQESHSVVDVNAPEQEENETDAAQAREHAERVLEQLRAGGHARQAAIAGIERMAFRGKASCRAAQIVLEEASAHDAAAFALGMRGHVRNAMQSKFANYVIQKILETLPMSRASFIVEELLGFGATVVRHRFGCRILCRVLEHGSLIEAATTQLLDEVLNSGVEELCNHEFGSYVIRHLLEFGLSEHRQKIANALSADVMGYSKQRYGSHVVEAAMKFCCIEDQRMLAKQLMASRDHLLSLASHPFGHHVIKGMLGVAPGEFRREIADAIHQIAGALPSVRYGKRVLQALNAATK